jgi:hypothetical protein
MGTCEGTRPLMDDPLLLESGDLLAHRREQFGPGGGSYLLFVRVVSIQSTRVLCEPLNWTPKLLLPSEMRVSGRDGSEYALLNREWVHNAFHYPSSRERAVLRSGRQPF